MTSGKSFKQIKEKASALNEQNKWLNRIFADSKEWYERRHKKEKKDPTYYIREAIVKHCLPKPRGYDD